ncbi:uncharacterized protein CIMG_00816 [Coccidioides immitis RS]|uniref:Uncharacterized protein n=4 Tax=Coccidioides immitis TaxID=5501 RepID=J3KHT7_COCIM|nr:uncharacterized protein CIMG_00816 [Coccidioides immitis RS]EAS35462.3 hypothetical protein CIMG_00816 [Coccidioides immitis RS]
MAPWTDYCEIAHEPTIFYRRGRRLDAEYRGAPPPRRATVFMERGPLSAHTRSLEPLSGQPAQSTQFVVPGCRNEAIAYLYLPALTQCPCPANLGTSNPIRLVREIPSQYTPLIHLVQAELSMGRTQLEQYDL